MIALALVCVTCLACVVVLARELAAERAARDARDQAHARALLELLERIQSPGVAAGPAAPVNLTVSEAEELEAWSRGEREEAAALVMAELDARERMGMETTDAERAHLADIAAGLSDPASTYSENSA